MAGNKELGQRGEALAARYLEQKGYTLLHRNLRFGRHEADLVALDGRTTVFVEVKTRSRTTFGRPEAAVDVAKRRAYVAMAEAYAHDHPEVEEMRFDVVAIVMAGATADIVHYEDVLSALDLL
ncbi:MAG: YraN family protein [Bacteroidales bacterium]|nr:YraN family protein [Bacteroidales bacterium]